MMIRICGDDVELNILDHDKMRERFNSECVVKGKNMYVDRKYIQELIDEEKKQRIQDHTYSFCINSVLENFYEQHKKDRN
jgi:hypothetical protein